MNQKLRSALQRKIVAVIRRWPRLTAFLETGNPDDHPQHLITELVDAIEEVLNNMPESEQLATIAIRAKR